ncbi:hypothetical protein M0802_016177 [Mischocyttarus mexicanus]|nr:hypothetical protein M0802_016177 [Mischocyttarus mexicanus]
MRAKREIFLLFSFPTIAYDQDDDGEGRGRSRDGGRGRGGGGGGGGGVALKHISAISIEVSANVEESRAMRKDELHIPLATMNDALEEKPSLSDGVLARILLLEFYCSTTVPCDDGCVRIPETNYGTLIVVYSGDRSYTTAIVVVRLHINKTRPAIAVICGNGLTNCTSYMKTKQKQYLMLFIQSSYLKSVL